MKIIAQNVITVPICLLTLSVQYMTDFSFYQEYRLTYRVFDDKFENVTTVVIQILDVNDNPPRFDNPIYNVYDLTEEERGITKGSQKYLLTVSYGLVIII